MPIPKKLSKTTQAKINWLRENGGFMEVVKGSKRHYTAVVRLAEGKASEEAIVNDVERVVKAIKFPAEALEEIRMAVAQSVLKAA